MTKKHSKLYYLTLVLMGAQTLFPMIVFAMPSDFRGVIQYILEIIYILVPILFALAFIVFFWGLSKFILNSGNAADIKKGRDYMIWSILALFVMVSIRAIISFVADQFELGHDLPLLPVIMAPYNLFIV